MHYHCLHKMFFLLFFYFFNFHSYFSFLFKCIFMFLVCSIFFHKKKAAKYAVVLLVLSFLHSGQFHIFSIFLYKKISQHAAADNYIKLPPYFPFFPESSSNILFHVMSLIHTSLKHTASNHPGHILKILLFHLDIV